MKLRRLTSKPRGLLRDATIVAGLVLLDPSVRFMVVGAGVFLVGTALHFWSKGCLVRNWVVTACGPYRLVRHPFYLANFFIDEGICVISGNLWLVALYVVAFLIVYLPTIRKEELYLIRAHGDTYTSYARGVPALLPYRVHAIFGPLDFAWDNITREKEASRVLRIVASPTYFVIVGALFHGTPHNDTDRVVVLCLSAALALLLTASSTVVRGYERAKRLEA